MEGVTEGPASPGSPGMAGQALPHGIFSLQRSIFIYFVVFWVLICFGFFFSLFSLRFYNLNSKPPEQMSDLLVIE